MIHHIIRILYIQFISFGDVLVSTAMVRKLKEKYPNSQIDYLTSSSCAPLLVGNPNINALYTERNTPSYIENYDIVLRPYKCLQSSGGWHLGKKHFMDLYAEICGVDLKGDYSVFYYNVDSSPSPLEKTKYILIQCKTNDSAKDYDRFEELVEKLKCLRFHVIQIAGPNDPKIKGVFDVVVNESWAKVARLIKNAITTICLDSAVQHLAGALNAHYIALYGPKQASMVRSGNKGNPLQWAMEPVHRNNCEGPCNLATCINPLGKCINLIEPLDVVSLVDKTLGD